MLTYINTAAANHKPPPLPTLLELLQQMSGCVVSTNVNGGNPCGNYKNQKTWEEDNEKKKAHKRGAYITIRKVKNENKRY